MEILKLMLANISLILLNLDYISVNIRFLELNDPLEKQNLTENDKYVDVKNQLKEKSTILAKRYK